MLHLLFFFWDWLHDTRLSFFVKKYVWVWPTCETLHFIGLAMLFGVIGILDLRMLGVAKSLPGRPLHDLLPWGIAGFIINLITGALFFAGDPGQYLHNWAFGFKMLFITLAGVNVLVFYATGVFRKIEALGPGEDAPPLAKFIGATSLFLWIGVMYWGRMLPFLGTSF